MMSLGSNLPLADSAPHRIVRSVTRMSKMVETVLVPSRAVEEVPALLEARAEQDSDDVDESAVPPSRRVRA